MCVVCVCERERERESLMPGKLQRMALKTRVVNVFECVCERESAPERERETSGNEPLDLMCTSPSSTHLGEMEGERVLHSSGRPPDDWETGTRRALL